MRAQLHFGGSGRGPNTAHESRGDLRKGDLSSGGGSLPHFSSFDSTNQHRGAAVNGGEGISFGEFLWTAVALENSHCSPVAGKESSGQLQGRQAFAAGTDVLTRGVLKVPAQDDSSLVQKGEGGGGSRGQILYYWGHHRGGIRCHLGV